MGRWRVVGLLTVLLASGCSVGDDAAEPATRATVTTAAPHTVSVVPSSTTVDPPTTDPPPATTPVPATTTSVEPPTVEPTVPASPRLLRTPTAAAPLRVMVVGDSVTYEIEPGLTAALQHTGLAVSSNRTQVGFGLSRWPVYAWWEVWPTFLDEVRPEAVVIQAGTWDIDDVWDGDDRIPVPEDPDWEASFAFLVRMAVDVLSDDGAHVYWLTMLPSPVSERPGRLNRLLRDVATTDDRMTVVDLTPDFTGVDGRYASHVDRHGAEWPIRKVDGVHLCREGGELAGSLAAAAILADAGLLLVPGWEDGPWRTDPRYDVNPCDDPAPAGDLS